MISDELRNKIEPYLMMELLPSEQKFIDLCFSETYLDKDKYGNDTIALYPLNNSYLTMEFFALNGAYSHMAFWEDAKARGRKL